MFRKLLGVALVMGFAAAVGFTQQTRSVYYFYDKEPIPSFEDIQKKLKNSSDEAGDYKAALKASDYEEAVRLRKQIADVLLLVDRLPKCESLLKEAGWTDEEFHQKLPKLVDKAKNIYKRLGEIQNEYKEPTSPGSFILTIKRILIKISLW